MMGWYVTIRCTVEEFVKVAEAFRISHADKKENSIVSWRTDYKKDDPFQSILLIHERGASDPVGQIHAIGNFDPSVGMTNHASLNVRMPNEGYETLWPIWTELREELESKDLIIGEPVNDFAPRRSPQKEDLREKSHAKAGRRRDPDYEWARKRVHGEGRDIQEVYREWLKRISEERRDSFANPWDSFKKAMRIKAD